jgi:hypothetical protein
VNIAKVQMNSQMHPQSTQSLSQKRSVEALNNGSNFMRDATGQIIIGVKGQQINVESNSSATTMYPNFFTRGNE